MYLTSIQVRVLKAAKAFSATAFAVLLAATSVDAREVEEPARPYVVGMDFGGSLNDRILEINDLRESGRPVEIRGLFCLSSCTMFLGVNDACIWPGTRFGFHGPSSKGAALKGMHREYWETTMASFYQEPIKSWFLERGSKKIKGLYWFTGTQLIDYGVARACGKRGARQAVDR